MNNYQVGSLFSLDVSFTQADVDSYAKLTGDLNPIHYDNEYAAKTIFHKPVIHGMYASSIFSRILGMEFPGEGTIYCNQNIKFKRPMFVKIAYLAVCEIKDIDKEKHRAIIQTSIIEKESGEIVIAGEAMVQNEEFA